MLSLHPPQTVEKLSLTVVQQEASAFASG